MKPYYEFENNFQGCQVFSSDSPVVTVNTHNFPDVVEPNVDGIRTKIVEGAT
jgi:hypothetical protein